MFNKSLRELIYATPQMYVNTSSSKWNNEALQVLVMTVMRQAVDPAALNECSLLKVSLESEDEIVIEDNGVGLPVAPPWYWSPDTPALTHLLEWFMKTGGRTKAYYEEFGFIDYFATLLNFLSELLRIDTVRQGQAYTVSCSNGDIITPLHKVDDCALKQGTRIYFKPDPAIFPSPAFSEELLEMKMNTLASEFPQVKFEFYYCPK